AAAAASLQEQASGLSQVVSVFKLDDEPVDEQAHHVLRPQPGVQQVHKGFPAQKQLAMAAPGARNPQRF
ncbi:MAG: methyl-accepting chemotaxis protein, partial [Pseudomonadota bacterium]